MNTTAASPPRTQARRRRTGIFVRGKRVLLGLLMLIVGVAALGASYEALASIGDTARYPPPGRLIDVGGYRLHLACTGSGGPTVVLVTGLGGSLLLWNRVQPLLTSTTQICTYDRAGLGWSDANDRERTPAAIATELHTLLTQAEIPGPYVLVGASVGGKYVRMFAEQYPNEVAGLVLVDARHESIDTALTLEEQAEGLTNVQRDAQLYRLMGRLGIMRLFGASFAAGMSPGAAKLPASTRTLLMLQAARSHSIDAMLGEYDGLTANDDRLRAVRSLGALPLVVLAADSSLAADPAWGAAQEAQRLLSANSRLIIVAQSSHHLALDQPEAVADAIRQVVISARIGQPLAP